MFTEPSPVLPAVHQVLVDVLKQNNSLESRKRVFALIVRGWAQGKTAAVLSSPPSADELIVAERLVLASWMFDTAVAFHKGHLTSLLPERHGPLIVTRGRLGEKSLERLLGVSALTVLMPSSRAVHVESMY